MSMLAAAQKSLPCRLAIPLLLAAGGGIAVPLAADLAPVVIGGVATLGGAVFLISRLRQPGLTLWTGTIVLSAFGPFLDIVTKRPVNWLFGLWILLFAGVLFVSGVLANRPSDAAIPPRGVGRRPATPVLGLLLAVLTGYEFLQALRPDIDIWLGLLNFRSLLIGLAAYYLTIHLFSGVTYDELTRRLVRLLTVFIVVGLIVAGYGLFQYLVGFDRLSAWGLTESGVTYLHNQRNLEGGTAIFRVFGTFRRNEVFGAFLTINIVACAILLQLRAGHFMLILVSLLTSLSALVLSLSLTSIGTLALWVGLLLLVSGSVRLWRRALPVLVSGLVVVIVVNQLLNGIISVRLAEHVLDTEEDIGRVRLTLNWIQELGDRPFDESLFGSGICTGADDDVLNRIGGLLSPFGVSVGEVFQCGWAREIHDNWYATHSLEVGLLGLGLIWSIFVCAAFWTLPRLRSMTREPLRGAWTMLALGVLMFWPSGFVGAMIVYMPITVYFWTLVGLLDVAVIAANGDAARRTTGAAGAGETMSLTSRR